MTDFYADYISKTTFDPKTNSVRSKLEEAATDTKKKQASKTPKLEVEPTEIPEKKELEKEELHGDQHKLDHNKDMKISASDIKMVRKKGAVKNHPAEAMIIRSKKSSAKLRRDAVSRPMGVREDDLSEIDANTMKSYMKKAKKQAVSISQKPNVNKSDMRKFGNRVKGISMAQKKLGEDQELEEATFRVSVSGLPTMHITGSSAGEIKTSLRKMLKDPKALGNIEKITPSEKKSDLRAKMSEDQTVADYLKKGGKITKLPAGKAQGAHGDSKMASGIAGRLSSSDTSRFKTKKKVKSMEDVEQVNELDKKTMGSYIKKATHDVDNRSFTQGMRSNNKDYTSADASNNRNIRNRRAGIARAANKMAEGAMKRMATQDAEKERLGPKVKGSGLDTFKKKPMGENYGEGEKDHITSHVDSKYGSRGGPGGSGVMHVGSHGGSHAYNTEPADHNDTHNSYAIHNEKTGKTHEIKLPPKAHSAAEVHKHIKPHGGSSTLAKHIANDHNSMHESNNLSEKDTHVTKDGRTAKKGLWYNIHKKRARGEAPAKPGDPDRPSAADLKRSQNEDTLDEGPFSPVGKFMMKRKMQKKMDSANKKMNYHSSQSAKMKSDQMNHVNARSKAGNEFQRANKIKDRLSR